MGKYRAANVSLVPDGKYVIATGDVEIFNSPDWEKIAEFNTTVSAKHKLVEDVLKIVEDLARNHALISSQLPLAVQQIEAVVFEEG